MVWYCMVLLLCMGTCCRSMHGCVSAVCTGACERGIVGAGGRVSTGASGCGKHGFV